MPVAVANGRALHRMRLDAKLDPPLADPRSSWVARAHRTRSSRSSMPRPFSGGAVDDLRRATPAVFAQLDRLSRTNDKIYIHIDMDVLDPREVEGHQNKVPNGPSSEEPRSVVRDDQSLLRRPRSGSRPFLPRRRVVARGSESDDRRGLRGVGAREARRVR